MTKVGMAKALGVTLKTYQSYIDGGTIPSWALGKLREVTGTTIDYLLGLADREEVKKEEGDAKAQS